MLLLQLYFFLSLGIYMLQSVCLSWIFLLCSYLEHFLNSFRLLCCFFVCFCAAFIAICKVGRSLHPQHKCHFKDTDVRMVQHTVSVLSFAEKLQWASVHVFALVFLFFLVFLILFFPFNWFTFGVVNHLSLPIQHLLREHYASKSSAAVVHD